ncbi:formate dehydrogenase accessory sulfurtransferase FdhD [Saccharolobus islandicus]|uniref:Sulfur carrier protein FdhD n=2 Tax=Saccharolobus islandicus TaxID=43080 RepID=F0NC71_SACI5|nr:formate dehydrogenase accessory sulfurtransferase FdhD [Sulfolobus islandicus]ADX83758.1 formate dehydrogenase family accessory protein FdhD [Sulfolobus islandicus HVE10/4]ADX86510.1 formate dehydrogenase family accessory protein FdhD [Sulfolobus islandicus REY15A]WCM37523.1 formate dehydrogenase accessory sulfurtransferase FdhD [Sulfolobus islandicus]
MQVKRFNLVRVKENEEYKDSDFVAVEEPLNIRVCFEKCEDFAIIMRTPGDDKELSLGFLYSEGVINSIHDVESIEQIKNNAVEVRLNKPVKVRIRDIIVNSSCGVCGRAFLYTLNILKSDLKVKKELIFSFPEKLREKQSVFNISGGLHATALFDPHGELLLIYEDVGRHNAVDKVVGKLLLEDKVPASNYIMQVSGRLGYEIVSKGIKAGIPIVCGISAPTSLAIEIAEEAGLTLIGFLRGKSFNIYTHDERIY